MKYWEIISRNLKKAGWSLGFVSAIDSKGRTIWIVDAHRGRWEALRCTCGGKADGVFGIGIGDLSRFQARRGAVRRFADE